MKKTILFVVAISSALVYSAQKLQLTEAATEYKNNFSKAWMMQPDQLSSNKAVLPYFLRSFSIHGEGASSLIDDECSQITIVPFLMKLQLKI